MESRLRLSQGALTAALLACALSAQAQARRTDLMATPECAAARLQFEVAMAADNPRRDPARLAATRRQAALACFGELPAGTPKGAPTGPALAVRPVDPPGSPTLRLAPMLAAPPPPVEIPRPALLGNCDAAGCWDSQGQRHNQMGPLLAGPHGPCTLQAGQLACP